MLQAKARRCEMPCFNKETINKHIYMAKKNKRDKMIDAIAEWLDEDSEHRTVFLVVGDRKEQHTSCATYGKPEDVCSSIINEMATDIETETIIKNAVQCLHEFRQEEAEKNAKANVEKPKTKLPKRMLS